MRIGITAGSRGISNIPVILKTLVDFVRLHGGVPHLLCAMGSHGGATSEGQRAVLAGLGITEESVGCPILSDMAVVPAGRNAEGAAVYMSRDAASMDGVIVCNRIKPHTCFRGSVESGLMKMMAKTNMKKIMALVLALVMILALAACGGSSSSAPSAPAATSGEAPAAPAAVATDPGTYLKGKNIRVVIGATSVTGDTYLTADLVTRMIGEKYGCNMKVDPIGAGRAF